MERATLETLSKEAEQDLEDLWVYLGERDDIAADRQVAKLLNRFPMLAQFPNMEYLAIGFCPVMRAIDLGVS